MMLHTILAAVLACSVVQGAQIQTKYEVQCKATEKCTYNEDDSECTCEGTIKPPNKELKDYFFESYDNQHNCVVSLKKPEKPRSLSFCHKFNDKACCPPVMDDENSEIFNQLTGLGLSCRLRGDIRDDPIAKWYCMNCDPEQPDYIRQASHPSHRGEDKDAVMLVLTSWASSEFGSDPILAGPDNRFKECGLLRSSPCLDHKGDAIDDRDRYTCGDDPYYPSSAIVIDAKDGGVDLKKSLEKFMMDIDMGPPALDDYGYKLIDDCTTPCTEEALKEHYAAALKGGAGAPSLMQPECIRTADQLTLNKYFLGVKNSKNVLIDTSFQDYFCTTQETPASCYDKEDKHLDCKIGKIKQNNPCCCADWKDEKCFSAASGLFSTTTAVWFALVAVTMHMLVA